ncbi:MAG: hypothetical protein KAI15_09160, partial [Gammaproteobacteria bacterium]|nr:hypothetical protein [Gammaproteobacteria bacterium]
MTKKPEDIKQEDQNLEDYLQGDSPLSKAYRAEEKAQPPVHLDKAIVAASNEAIRSEQTSNIAYSPFARTWYVPASMVAVLVLCVGLVFTIYQNSGQTLLTAPKSKYDFDAEIVPMPMAIGPDESEESRVSGEKHRQLEYADEVLDEDEISMDMISEDNRPVPQSIES